MQMTGHMIQEIHLFQLVLKNLMVTVVHKGMTQSCLNVIFLNVELNVNFTLTVYHTVQEIYFLMVDPVTVNVAVIIMRLIVI